MTPNFHRLAAEEARHVDSVRDAAASLRSTVSLMQTGAHPDDETSGLLALLGRRYGLHLAYACATRGEGGQNVLGPERGDDLAMIRAREMALASRSLGCALHWLSEGPDDRIRDWRFSKSAEETLEVWGREHTLERMVRIIRTVQPDILCPTFLDVGGQHGHHRAMTRIALEAYHVAADARAFPRHLELGLKPWAASKFYLPAWSGAGSSYDDDAPPPAATVPHDIGEVETATGVPYARIGEWSRRFHATQDMGEWLEAATMPRPLHLAASRIGPAGRPEASVLDGIPATLADWAAAEMRWRADLTDAHAKLQHVSAQPRRVDVIGAAMAAVDELESRASKEPVSPSLVAAIARTRTATIRLLACAQSKSVDAATVSNAALPHLELEPSPRRIVVNRNHDRRAFPVSIALRANAHVENAAIAVGRAAGISASPLPSVDLRSGETSNAATSITFDVAVSPSRVRLPLIVSNRAALTHRRANYPHTGEVSRLCDAVIDVQIVDAAIAPGTRVAYAGAGLDRIDHRLAEIGIPVARWTPDFSAADISTIVIGIQAFGKRDDLAAAIPSLHMFVREGGHLVTFYHRPQDRFGTVPLAPIEIGIPSVRWRVTRADAPVTVLSPGHKLLTAPNVIAAGDWAGWRKERGLYFASRWDAAYTPLLAMSDPGEPPLHGALLSGQFGKGRHTHCALTLNTELDELVPGVFRLLANLVQPA